MILGCIAALFIVPDNTPAWIFWSTCAFFILFFNVMLFTRSRKPVEPTDNFDWRRTWAIAIIGLLVTIWQLYERYGR